MAAFGARAGTVEDGCDSGVPYHTEALKNDGDIMKEHKNQLKVVPLAKPKTLQDGRKGSRDQIPLRDVRICASILTIKEKHTPHCRRPGDKCKWRSEQRPTSATMEQANEGRTHQWLSEQFSES